jgi:hypothetical protein
MEDDTEALVPSEAYYGLAAAFARAADTRGLPGWLRWLCGQLSKVFDRLYLREAARARQRRDEAERNLLLAQFEFERVCV